MDEDPPTSRYVFVKRLAEGGMGQVELAVRSEGRFRRIYAVKRLRDAYRGDENVERMFLEEARLAGLVRHANVVSVLDVGRDERGPMLVMELVEGVSLAKLLRVTAEADQQLPVQLAVRLVRDVARGLHAAHDARGHDGQPLSLVHRDVSPQNILIGYDGVARITDFGIAKAIGGVGATSTGLIKGKAGYISPEQLRFDVPDRRSDLFSLGVVFYESLTAKRLYQGRELAKVAKRILSEPPPDVLDVRADVHPMLVALLFQLLSKEPEQRPATAKEVVQRLDEVLVDLVAAEGVFSVEDYLEERFGDDRIALAEELEELRTTVVAAPVAKPAGEGRRRVRGALLVAAALALIGGGVALGMGLAADPEAGIEEARREAEAADAPLAGAEPAAVEPVTPVPATPSAAATESTTATADDAPPGAETEDAAAESDPTPVPRQRRRRQGRARPRRARMAASSESSEPEMAATPGGQTAGGSEGIWGWDQP